MMCKPRWSNPHVPTVSRVLHVLACWAALHILTVQIVSHAIALHGTGGPSGAAGGPRGPLLKSRAKVPI